ncbi:RNA 3'-terminal phosphate cyclase [Methanotrichaceae archaeon M04Ac]|uniref:RNA 3'-terminal phosphate cyclase n=1 Tax=Candidatus Methanocrinis alkalitolerans TaxID=3033395 RepID=A0ABT5XH95_9EURY|nr:RNA 3'-terminal phosphate cyclase [Candidatus Methanocrinis alkalitolerans]MCR3884094.1 RNA 3'-terminal phosphate cyclase [Methanothrix sp.]MDF0594090.1 RNA 3'-terminal phosphate cyclase [Candidatus Methanocrinis alkalitolerans]
MIEIDGSFGEGGGQIVRTAVALSAVTGDPVRITRIRDNRPKPGLSPQHATAIKALARVADAEIQGVKPGSAEIIFRPRDLRGGEYEVDIGTAGSVTLLIQCLLPALVFADSPATLIVRGGTDVRWSPTIDYLSRVALPAFGEFAVRSTLSCERRGYHPRGGGIAVLKTVPGKLQRADLSPSKFGSVDGVSHSSNLPEHVARRQAKAAREILKGAGYRAEIGCEATNLPSTGSGITLWSGRKGASALGERGLLAEKVGAMAAEEMVAELGSKAAVDRHLSDQLVPYLALAGGSYTAPMVSSHASTNIWTAQRFLDVNISVEEGEVAIFRADP